MAPKTSKPKTKTSKVQYTVTPLDVDGDGIPDGDLVTKYVNGKVETSKYVPLKKLKSEYKKAVASASKPKTRTVAAQEPQASQKQVVYRNMPQDIQQSNNTVMVSDQTGFGQYVKQGAGFAVGGLAVDAAVSAISGLFSEE